VLVHAAKLKTDARKVVNVISADEAKARAYCEMRDLGEQIEQDYCGLNKRRRGAIGSSASRLHTGVGT
jgi:hypothetical protein